MAGFFHSSVSPRLEPFGEKWVRFVSHQRNTEMKHLMSTASVSSGIVGKDLENFKNNSGPLQEFQLQFESTGSLCYSSIVIYKIWNDFWRFTALSEGSTVHAGCVGSANSSDRCDGLNPSRIWCSLVWAETRWMYFISFTRRNRHFLCSDAPCTNKIVIFEVSGHHSSSSFFGARQGASLSVEVWNIPRPQRGGTTWLDAKVSLYVIDIDTVHNSIWSFGVVMCFTSWAEHLFIFFEHALCCVHEDQRWGIRSKNTGFSGDWNVGRRVIHSIYLKTATRKICVQYIRLRVISSAKDQIWWSDNI